MGKPKDGEIFHFVEFTFSIPARGLNNDELKQYAVEELYDEMYHIMKDLVRNPEHAEIGEKIEPPELQDYFYDLEDYDWEKDNE